MKKRFCRLTQAIIATIGDKIVDTLYSNRVTSENKRIKTHPRPLHSNLGCLLFSIGCSNSGTTLHGGGKGGKAIYPYFEVRKTAKCLNLICRRL